MTITIPQSLIDAKTIEVPEYFTSGQSCYHLKPNKHFVVVKVDELEASIKLLDFPFSDENIISIADRHKPLTKAEFELAYNEAMEHLINERNAMSELLTPAEISDGKGADMYDAIRDLENETNA